MSGKEIKREKIVASVKEFSISMKEPEVGVYVVTVINEVGFIILKEKVIK